MCEAVGYPVRALHRPRYGPLALGHLRPGDWRMLNGRELEALRGDG
jgi:16S rRNA U516 pseudouridylate synthase RsuA-like enzyme